MAIKEDGSVVFEGAEQQELDRIVGERLAREKSKYANYEELDGIRQELQAAGYEGTPSEIRAKVKEQREAFEASQATIEELEEKQEGGERLTQAEKKLLEKASKFVEKEEKKQEEEEKQSAQQTYYNQQKELLLEKHNIDADDLEKNSKFMKFVKGKSISDLCEVYEDFVDFIGQTEADAIIKTKSKEERSTSGGKNANAGGSHGLTDAQKQLVDEWNEENPRLKMSYKDYAEKL